MRQLPLHQQLLSVVGLSCVALLLSLLLKGVLTPALPFTGVVLASAWYFGNRGGFAAIAICGTMVLLFVLAQSGPGLVEFGAFAVLNSILTLLIQHTLGRLASFDRVLSSLPDAIVVADQTGLILYMNDQAEALLGAPLARVRKKPIASTFRFRERSNGAPVNLAWEETLRGNTTTVSSRVRRLVLVREGSPVEVEESITPLREETGAVGGVILTIRDTTRRREAEDQLSRSQKMDAIARLSGGLAGDFNNFLTVITGFGEMLRDEMPHASPNRRFAEEILFAAERAIAHTRQLMALSRQQSSQNRLLDLNTTLRGMETMLKRLLGEKINLMILLEPRSEKILADPGQLEQLIVNLAMNSRDAMPQGGNFVIETSVAELEPSSPGKPESLQLGSYVLLSVSDTGIGMDSDTLARLFEPFFTTKGQGKSTGLGLSIVYGIVRQSGGDISVYSQPGNGTVFEIYFPRAKEQDVPVRHAPRAPRGTETILVADDDDGVRKLVHAVLATSGYTVHEFVNGRDALLAYQTDPTRFDLVLTDVVMPHLDGLELGDRIAELRPSQKVLYMSGFRDSPTMGHIESGRQRSFLHKPFTPDSLLSSVREVLDGRGSTQIVP